VAHLIGGHDAMTTTGVRVYLHSPVRRRYLAAVVAPEVRGLARHFGAHQIHVRTGWLAAPHYELRAEPSAGRPIDWPAVAAALAAGAHRHPAAPLDGAAYLHTAAELGRIEAVPPPYPPLQPHGATELLAPAPPGAVSALAAQGLALLLTPLLQTAQTDGAGALLARVAEAFVALAASHPHGPRFGAFSFRSHAEAFFHWAGPAADYRTLFRGRRETDGAVFEELVRRARDGRTSAPAGVWHASFNACMEAFAGQLDEDDLDRPGTTLGVGALRRADGRSAFHEALAQSGVIDEPPQWFAAFRLTINLFYQLLPALDISPVQRFYLCDSVAESVDAVYGETWEQRLAAIKGHLVAS
jgi:hypothetical protein